MHQDRIALPDHACAPITDELRRPNSTRIDRLAGDDREQIAVEQRAEEEIGKDVVGADGQLAVPGRPMQV
ncbi:MAG TPA: hypothetical protein VGG27_03580 [Magnetospirillaceae bacterium]